MSASKQSSSVRWYILFCGFPGGLHRPCTNLHVWYTLTSGRGDCLPRRGTGASFYAMYRLFELVRSVERFAHDIAWATQSGRGDWLEIGLNQRWMPPVELPRTGWEVFPWCDSQVATLVTRRHAPSRQPTVRWAGCRGAVGCCDLICQSMIFCHR